MPSDEVEVSTDRFVTCPVTGESIDTTVPSEFNVLTSTEKERPYTIISSKASFGDVISSLTLIDGRLYESQELELGEFVEE